MGLVKQIFNKSYDVGIDVVFLRICPESFMTLPIKSLREIYKDMLEILLMLQREMVYVLLVHLFVYFARVDVCPSSLRHGVGGWLRLLIVAPRTFLLTFLHVSRRMRRLNTCSVVFLPVL